MGCKMIAVDYGRRRVGVAGCNDEVAIAFGLDTLQQDENQDLAECLAEIMIQRGVKDLVLGLPITLGDRPGDLCAEILTLADRLSQRGYKVHLVDEALSSRKAQAMLRQRGKRHRKEDRDRASAALLLQEYLDGQLPEIGAPWLEKIRLEIHSRSPS
jgi:putative Holliday junction resolvase